MINDQDKTTNKKRSMKELKENVKPDSSSSDSDEVTVIYKNSMSSHLLN